MNRLGIDYGTTNTVVVCSDRGRYPVVPHQIETAVGSVASPVFPSLAIRDRETGRYHFGAAAERMLVQPGAANRYDVIRSLKRWIRSYTEGRLLGQEWMNPGFDPALVLRAFAEALRQSVAGSGLFGGDEIFEAVVTWPANANGAQRYLTRRCFKDAGFRIIDGLNEPTAAAIEFADRLAHGNRAAARRVSTSVAVFDLGGGTFDVSLVAVRGSEFTVLESKGIEHLGGDDFDEVLARMFAGSLGIDFDGLDSFRRSLLLTHARQQKESIASGSVRSLTFAPQDVGWKGRMIAVPVRRYYAELTPLLTPALDKLESVVNGEAARAAGIDPDTLQAIYLVGGSSLLPLVPTLVAKRFPHVKLVLSDKPFTSVAMGAAIHSRRAVRVHEILARTFGVLRLADGGTREYFAPIFPAGTRLPGTSAAPLEHTVDYSPHHNIGYLRYLECATLDSAGQPAEGVRHWSDALFPYDPSIPERIALSPDQVVSRGDLLGTRVRESYQCDPDGVITARLTRCCDGFTAIYEVFKS
jgi:molecular chaperone DnaK (HSP70)